MQTKRIYVHDYTRVGFYMITIVTADRSPLFGACREDRTYLSAAGETIRRRWHEIPSHCPAMETSDLVVMPDHLHGIVYVKEAIPKPLASIMRGFKSGFTSELRKKLASPPWRSGARTTTTEL